MKSIILATIVAVPAFAFANRSLETTPLDHLAALDGQEQVQPVADAITAINERALAFLPTAATLRAEDTVAAVALAVTH